VAIAPVGQDASPRAQHEDGQELRRGDRLPDIRKVCETLSL
jgi:hypothetical protein